MPCSILLSCTHQKWDNYNAAVEAAGGRPCAFYLPEVSCQGWDGLILCGGASDVQPERYGRTAAGARSIDLRRDEAELALVHCFARAGKPILGICRGLQVLNAALGGTLVQDLPGHDREGGDLLHPSTVLPGSWLHDLYGAAPTVNSAHHQAVETLAPGLVPAQWSPDGVLEGAAHSRLPIWGVQWHPERLCLARAREDAADGLAVFRHFLAACRRRAEAAD